MYDIVIIGAGPAGLSAAIYARRAGKTVLLLEESAYGGQIVNTPEIENYPGIKNISGFEFATNLYQQATGFGAEFKFEKALEIENLEDKKMVKTAKGEYEAKAVIIATGAKNRKLGLNKEDSLVGRGVSYCATCDGMFFKGKDVSVNGGGNTAIEDAGFLSNYCNKVYVIHRRDQFRADESDVEKIRNKDNVEFVLNSTVEELVADDSLSAIIVKDKNTGETREIPVSGLFVAIGQQPDNKNFENIVELENGYVKGLEDCKTNVDGIYVAGDCRTKTVRQLTTAASDGAVAALAACEKIDK